jgi:hypothetical protein
MTEPQTGLIASPFKKKFQWSLGCQRTSADAVEKSGTREPSAETIAETTMALIFYVEVAYRFQRSATTIEERHGKIRYS